MEPNMILIPLPLADFQELLETSLRQVLQTDSPPVEKAEHSAAEPLLTIEEAAAYFGRSRQTIHEWKRKGIIPFHRISGRIYFKQSELAQSLRKVHLNTSR